MTSPGLSVVAARVAPFLAMDVLAQAGDLERNGRSIIHMELGQPAHPAPRPALEAARKCLESGRIGYTEALGLPTLRSRISRHYREFYGLDVPAERIVVTTGSSGGFILTFLALFNPGDRIAIAAPGYPAYRNILVALGLVPVEIPLQAADRWVLTAKALESAHESAPLAGVLTMSPANPSGTVMSAAALADIVAACRKLRLKLISDEIYQGLTYEAPATSALRFSDEVVVVNSFSKYFCMTGWRVGWLVVPPALVRPIERLQQSLAISVPYLSQVAAEAAFAGMDEMELVKAGYAENRAMLLENLPKLGIADFHPVDGAFYIYADIGQFTNDSLAFCRRLLQEAGLALTPGVDFDSARGAHTVRFSFAGSLADTREALARLKIFLRR